ncbi:MAG: hydrogenase maturation nickel metallochaperone HypA [Clostridia bacterium]|nr:hydrogenase maturation nickel metallochaperone HypA [Clostridia bacterium]MBQ4611349.1 hydrogenase maturation nickel metallochaperone HypA [Clostridia bacterium]MBR2155556.1 hydrogenase maturation nickel metallochaperone HypA [Clostridia bacterium]MBR2329336.1 hydrogenase maturation nickel metallochaperone HypA [Clostridia bacterium]MBR4019169.1 hydrogenase maturation nickel metallochaperone HypA [Clostridia bacterium]
MHELGVVFRVSDSVVKVAEQNNVQRVHSVTLEIGQVSTVIPEYLEDIWKWNCKRVPMLNDCELIIEQIHAITRCEDCEKTYDTVPQGRICPYCGSERTFLVTGNEFNIKEIAVE